MERSIETILIFTLLPVITVILGGIISAYRQPSRGPRILIQHFAAGVVFSAVALQISPELVLKPRIFPLVIGFSLGVVFMIGADWIVEKLISGNNEVESRVRGVKHSLLASTCLLTDCCSESVLGLGKSKE